MAPSQPKKLLYTVIPSMLYNVLVVFHMFLEESWNLSSEYTLILLIPSTSPSKITLARSDEDVEMKRNRSRFRYSGPSLL